LTRSGRARILPDMMNDVRARGEARLDEALAERDLADPRDPYRETLRRLKERDPASFDRARRHYEEYVQPRLADPGTDPVTEWIDYGRFLTGLEGNGTTLQVTTDGRAEPFEPPPRADALILFVPDQPAQPALLLSRANRLTPPQQATLELLIR
jgi:hypothetical protein